MRMNTSWMVIVLSTLPTQGLLQAQGPTYELDNGGKLTLG